MVFICKSQNLICKAAHEWGLILFVYRLILFRYSSRINFHLDEPYQPPSYCANFRASPDGNVCRRPDR
jgi:hypothetical protein